MVRRWYAANGAGQPEDAEALGVSLAEELLDNGARDILAAFMMEKPHDEHSGHPSTPARRSAGQPSARMGRVAWSFPLIEFTPGRELPALGDQLARLGPTICCLRCRSMRWNLPMPAAAAGPALAHFPLFCHWPHDGAGPAYGQRADIRYPLDREISEVLLQLPELQNIAGKKRSSYAAMAGGNS
jgi:hypothetical protein